ncbi:MFS multidrug transporter [Marssonina coronariae]|uniref:MFS multidrug transporter n=1 Tax=Diplocarpon coronariae TaxID=2795749 RepID=A0A218YU40_9HELO|nr:MFS multidrug transporter [Marssonina coronariae]
MGRREPKSLDPSQTSLVWPTIAHHTVTIGKVRQADVDNLRFLFLFLFLFHYLFLFLFLFLFHYLFLFLFLLLLLLLILPPVTFPQVPNSPTPNSQLPTPDSSFTNRKREIKSNQALPFAAIPLQSGNPRLGSRKIIARPKAMTLTIQRSTRDPEKFPTAQLFLLGTSVPLFPVPVQVPDRATIVRLAEPIALTSIFPYAWPLVKKFHVGDESNASFYAGLLISAFALAESLTGMFWGAFSDTVGRKPVLLLGCAGTILSMIVVGFSSNIWMALAGRALGGFLNGNIGVIQTMVAELVTKPEHEPRAYCVMPFVWSIGTILGPALGGTFADPATNFPNTFSQEGLFGRYPYLLPNLLCSSLLIVSILAGYFLLEETHPDMQPRVNLPETTYVSDETPLIGTADAMKMPAVDLRAENYGTINSSNGRVWRHTNKKTNCNCNSRIFNPRVAALIAALGIFTYHSMTYDHLLPIFLEDERGSISISSALAHFNPFHVPGGLGLTIPQVGFIISMNGIVALFVQAVIFPFAAARLGIHKLFVIVSLLHPVSYITMPYLIYLPPSSLMLGIYICLTIRNMLSIIAYPVLLILLKEATPSPGVLGRVNGLAASAGAACRTIAPPVSGFLYTLGSRMEFTGLAWYGSAFVAAVGALQCFSVKREKQDVDEEWKHNAASPGTPTAHQVVS